MFADGLMITRLGRDRLIPGPRGVRKIVDHKCSRGFTLFCCAFGSTQYLIDMNGMVVQAWAVTHSQLGEILPNGNLFVDNHSNWLEEITPAGQQVWKWEGHVHHDFHVGDDCVWTLAMKQPPAPLYPNFYEKNSAPEGMRNDVIYRVTRKGVVDWEFSFRDHIDDLREASGLTLPVRYRMMDSNGNLNPHKVPDWVHPNTVEVLPDSPAGRKDPRFRAGNILFSLRALDTIGVIDPDKNKIVWAWGLGILDGQHQPTMTPAGTILLFDNGTARGWSAVLEIDPITGKEVWRYENRADFYSAYRAGAQRLPNGNTLVAESDAARIFEVTSEKEIVWDYLNPFFDQTPGNQGLHVFRATRYTPEYAAPVFAARADEPVITVCDTDRRRLTTRGEALKYYLEGMGG
ncbi:MAG: hypothetical protein NTW86_21455 [Candidatus Sumerlaeota bacterium]|nr:hypothetical protein [Candidatus Sumerlaeota bacterium]